MASPNISIVIPNYGYGRFFARLAEDLACQTFGLDSVEILLVDDGSIDDSRREAAHLEALPTHTFAAFWLDHCGAPGTVRNHGLERSRGNLLLCLDPDDRLASGFLESCVMALDGHPEASLAYSDYIYEDSSGARTVSLPSFDPGLLRNQNILPRALCCAVGCWMTAAATAITPPTRTGTSGFGPQPPGIPECGCRFRCTRTLFMAIIFPLPPGARTAGPRRPSC